MKGYINHATIPRHLDKLLTKCTRFNVIAIVTIVLQSPSSLDTIIYSRGEVTAKALSVLGRGYSQGGLPHVYHDRLTRGSRFWLLRTGCSGSARVLSCIWNVTNQPYWRPCSLAVAYAQTVQVWLLKWFQGDVYRMLLSTPEAYKW